MRLFGRLFSALMLDRGPGEAESEAVGAAPGGPAVSILQEALDTMERLLREEPSSVSASAAAVQRDREALLEAEREANRTALRQEILDLHEQLGTGLDREALDRLRTALVAHAAPCSFAAGATVAERIERQVLRHLYTRSGERAWDRLRQLMDRSGMAWPVSPELALGRTQEEHRKAEEQACADARLAFVLSPAPASADLMEGWVAVWSHYYPPHGSPLWRETALAGVGSALRAVHFLAVVEAWLWRSPALEERVRRLLEERIEAVRTLVAKPCPSLAEATHVAGSVDRLLGVDIPRTVWEEVADGLSWDDAVPGGLALSTLSDRPGSRDPVCGMTLQAHQVAERCEWREGVLYFCSASCRAAFQAEPSRFGAGVR